MGKNKNKKNKSKKADTDSPKKMKMIKEKEEEKMITLEDLDAMSSDDDDDGGDEVLLDEKTKKLRKAIADGKLNDIFKKLKDGEGNDDDDDDEEEFEEATLDSSSDGDDDVKEQSSKRKGNVEADNDDESDDEEEADDDDDDEDEDDGNEKQENEYDENQSDDDGDDDDDDEEEEMEDNKKTTMDPHSEKIDRLKKNNVTSSKALSVVTADLVAAHARLPWAETFDVIAPTPLPFSEGKRSSSLKKQEGEEGGPVDIHDDLKREVAFYNMALEAVNVSRTKCNTLGIPFSRPEDFFAEMVKTDDHMAKVKDRLIFETKKMEAVAQRKANREHKLRAKESQANKLAEKAKRKREHFQQVEEWADNAAKNRGNALRDDDDDDNMFLQKQGKNRKREASNRKFGFGGKKGRFKQNDRSSMNDVSGYNPRGNFPGGMKKTSRSSSSSSGAGRQGKRARDAKRARRN